MLRRAGALLCMVLTACASTTHLVPHESPQATASAVQAYESDELQPALSPGRPVPLSPADFQQAVQRLLHGSRLHGTPQQDARQLLQASQELEGEWLAEAFRGRVLTLTPVEATSSLTPEADATLRQDYLRWCESRGAGDCLGLLDDGPTLHMDDRRTLALALALDSVLQETHSALAQEVNPRALLSLLVWTVSLYAMTWLLPEPITKAVAATLTVLLVGWLGLDTVWGLMDGWVGLVTQAYEATTFAQLQAAGAQYSRVLGTNAARALILAAGVVTGQAVGALAKTARPMAGELAARVRSLPGYLLADAQWEAQGGSAVLGRVRVVQAQQQVAVPRALAVAAETVQAMLSSPQGPLSVMLLQQGGTGPGGGGSTTVIRHRGGNQQVVLANGQRWHLPRGKWLADIPAQDTVGDQLQEAVTRAAQRWGPDKLSNNEKAAINEALRKGRYWLARLLEREARGRFVEATVRDQLDGVYIWNSQGVDIIDPTTGTKYEILSGTESNMARHGRRMASELFRMLSF